ncbi:YcxB family protein [Streptomyces luteoverticillatus]|uniref:YcxB family protein n=1 Tax=Streptomyces luteoverticillatus TaxID=66425 RepID=A0A3S9PGK8_STRLT|nr:YcxB family protein [Streptomyces luteoverticillatus]AZQ71476.1 YcxB family protein [Streptomyces luteoverticillatus]
MSDTVTAAGSLTFEYELTATDIRSGLHGRNRAVRSARWQRILLPVCTVLMAVGFIAPHGPGAVAGKDWIALTVMTVMVTLVLFLPTIQARALHKTARLQGPTRTTVEADGLSSASAHSSQRMAWTLFGRYVERDDVFVLMSADKRSGCLIILPKRALTAPGDIDMLRAMLDSRVPRA